MNNQPQPSANISDGEKLTHIQDLLGRMQELAQRVASGKCTPEQCAGLQQELAALHAEMERVMGYTE